MSCGIGCRHSSDPMLLWLWCRLAAAAPISPLAWELPHTSGAALKRSKKKKKKTGRFGGCLCLQYNLIYPHTKDLRYINFHKFKPTKTIAFRNLRGKWVHSRAMEIGAISERVILQSLQECQMPWKRVRWASSSVWAHRSQGKSLQKGLGKEERSWNSF